MITIKLVIVVSDSSESTNPPPFSTRESLKPGSSPARRIDIVLKNLVVVIVIVFNLRSIDCSIVHIEFLELNNVNLCLVGSVYYQYHFRLQKLVNVCKHKKLNKVNYAKVYFKL